MELSIVTPMYQSAAYIEEFYRRVSATALTITQEFEIILVNDGSPDKVLEIALKIQQKDPRICIIDLSRNFGQHKAMMTGLAYAQGNLVFLIDCDLEIRPEILEEFHTIYKQSDADVIYGVQEARQDSFFNRLGGEWFYKLFNSFSDVKLPHNLTTVRLMSQRYVQALVAHREREVLIGGLWSITGFKQVPVEVFKQVKGSTTYHFGRKISLIVNALTSFSNRPLIYIFYLGSIIVFLSFIAAIFLVIETLRSGFLPGWPSLIVSVWMLGGLTIFCLGIVGIYVAKIFLETKQRPYTIIRHIYRENEYQYEYRSHPDQHGILLQQKD